MINIQKKLPKIFENEINKTIKNNANIYTTTKNKIEQKQSKEKNDKTTIEQKIKTILNTKGYTYKIPVKIKLKNKEINTYIIGKNKNKLITIDNILIKIDEILDIEIKNE